jgi:predicted DCC family thiol-disulfide oxidoreductase YuxK
MAERDHLIFYDRDCGFCRRMLRIVLWLDQKAGARLSPVALQNPDAQQELPGLDDSERMASWHLKSPSGEIASGGAALAPLIELVGLPHSLASMLRNHPALPDRVYRWVAAHRQLFGRLTRGLPDLEDHAG